MEDILHANIFFFITGIAVIVLSSLLVVALYHLIKILKSVRAIVARIEMGAETIVDDIEQIRSYIVEESFLARFFRVVLKRTHGADDDEYEDNTSASPRAPKAGRKPKTELKIKQES